MFLITLSSISCPYMHCFISGFYCISQRRQWHPTPVLLPGKSHGRRSLVGCSPWGREESDMTERLHFHFSLSCIGEGNGNPLQCSCLENPRDRGAWWASVHGVSQSQTRLKRLSSRSNIAFQWNLLVFMSVPYCSDYYRFGIYFEIWKYASSFVLSQDCFSYSVFCDSI